MNDARMAELTAAKSILDRAKAEGRGLRDSERQAVHNHWKAAEDLAAKAAGHDDGELERKLFAAIKGRPSAGDPFGGRNITTPKDWAVKAAEAITGKGESHYGAKALVSGTLSLPAVSLPGVGLAELPSSFLDLFTVKPLDSNAYGYVRQTLRTNNAAPVADLGTKPTSVFNYDEVEGKAEVVAHLSEPFPKRYLDDHQELIRLLEREMAYGVVRAMENQALNGTGTDPQWDGLANTSGTLAQAFDTDMATTLRKALTTLLATGEAPNAYVIHPTDLEALTGVRVDAGAGQYLDYDPAFRGLREDQRPPMVLSTAVPAGTAWLGDWSFATLFVREGLTLDMDMGGTLFDTNAVKFRAEQRANVGFIRPSAFIEIDLTAV